MNIVSAAHYLNNGYKVYRTVSPTYKVILIMGKYVNGIGIYDDGIYQQLMCATSSLPYYIEKEFVMKDLMADDWEILHDVNPSIKDELEHETEERRISLSRAEYVDAVAEKVGNDKGNI